VEEEPGPDPDPGIADIIAKITRIWSVEDSDFRKLENGFEWLPGSHAVQVRVARHVERPDRIRIWIATDFLRSVPVESGTFVHLLGASSKFLCAGSSVVYPPLEVWKKYFDNHPANVEFFSSAYVDQHTAGWLPEFLAQTAIMQPINAEIQSTNAPKIYGGGEPAYADGQKKDRVSDMLFVAEHVLVPEGRKDSKWIGCEEFRKFADEYGKCDVCFDMADDNGMSLETPFGDDSALINFRTDQRHPQLGSGLLVYTQIRSSQNFCETCVEAAGLNFLESKFWTDFPQLGCWHPHITTEKETNWAHSCFIPNALFMPGLVEYLGVWSVERVQWVRRTRFPKLENKAMDEILLNRFARAAPNGHLH
jgi:hypothetical protein